MLILSRREENPTVSPRSRPISTWIIGIPQCRIEQGRIEQGRVAKTSDLDQAINVEKRHGGNQGQGKRLSLSDIRAGATRGGLGLYSQGHEAHVPRSPHE